MNRIPQSLKTVLWAAVGLGGRRADADTRVDRRSIGAVLLIAVFAVLALVLGLALMARYVAGQ